MSKTIAHLLTPTLPEVNHLDANARYPVFSTPMSAGFYSPADDYIEAQQLSDEGFCRLTGLKRPTFEAALVLL